MNSQQLINQSGPVFLCRRLENGTMVEIGEVNPLPVTAADKGGLNFAGSTVANNATPGVWTEILAANTERLGAAIQNGDDAALIYIVQSAEAPANGVANGELGIPVSPAYYEWPFSPRGRWWMRSDTTISPAMVWSW